jgi:D-alanyl-D-alanine carboxypeptidase/D-alanyl-D-alanine-endopeptidase (penicillin-binding protein 4)
VRRVRSEAFLTLALLNIFVLIAGFTALDVIEARPLPAAPHPVVNAEGAVAAEPASSSPADPERIADVLDDPMTGSGLAEGLSAFVVDGATGEPLYERSPDTSAVPASTTKIATAITVLDAVGPDHVLTTTVHFDSERGMVVLRGAGDATLTTAADPAAYPQVATLEELAERTAAALAEQGVDTVSVAYDDSLFTGPDTGPSWKPGYITEGSTASVHALMHDSGRISRDTHTRVPDPPRATAEAFAEQLGAAGLTVEGGEPSEAPAQGEPIASVDSAPMTALVEHMMLASDNNMAEALGRIAALEAGGEASFAGGAEATHRVMESYGITGVDLADNSGLSPGNRITPRALVEMLKVASEHPELNAAITGLPTSNSTGTLNNRYTEGTSVHDVAGLIRGKTGTLNDVSALAGTVHDQEGNMFLFAFVANSPGVQGYQLDPLAAALARCGCS